jgi:hypothetical protein
MSLTVALMLLAGAVLLAIALQGWWAMRRARPRRPQAPAAAPAAKTAAAGAATRLEPALDATATAAAAVAPAPRLDAGAEAGGWAGPAAALPGRTGADAAHDASEADTGIDAATAAGIDADSGPDTVAGADDDFVHDAEHDADGFENLPLRTMPRQPQRLDALIDALVPLVPDHPPVSGDAVLAHLPSSRHAGTKPWTVEGLDLASQAWEPIVAGRRYAELQAGVQLSSRSGPLNEIEYSEFVQQVEALAEALGARADLPDMLEVMARARELDALASPLDAQLTLTLRSNSVAWSVPYVQQVAQRHGFLGSGRPGRYVLPAEEPAAPPLLVLTVDPQAALAVLEGNAPASAVREAQLVLDLAQTAEALDPYPAWHRMASQLAEDLDATPVDDHGQPLTLQAFSAIGGEVDQVYRRLEALDLAAGSAAARRLFS